MNKLSVIERIKLSADQYPDRPALYVNETFYSYRELLAYASAIKIHLDNQGAVNEKIIGVLTNDDIFTCASIIAIIACGAAYLPINKKNPCDRNVSIISQADLNVVLASSFHPPLEDVNQSSSMNINVVDTSNVTPTDEEFMIESRGDDDLLYLLFTSGSTGVPKGVPIYDRNLSQFLWVNIESGLYEFKHTDRFLQMFELTFDFSVMTYFVPLSIGACCFMVPSSGITYMNIINILEQHKITVAAMVPSVLTYLERFYDELHFDALRYSIFCGEPLTYQSAKDWSKCIPNAVIQNAYGPTEATVYCTSYDVHEHSDKELTQGILPIGKPFPGMSLMIIDEEKKQVENGQVGELCLAGMQVTDQYWKDVEKTQNSFFSLNGYSAEIFYRTGDLAYINEHGDYVHCGRIDHQTKIDGHRVELGEIENIAREFTEQSQVIALVSSSEENADYLKLYLKKESESVTKKDLVSYMRSKLPPYMVPREIIYIDNFPLNVNGKVDRKKLACL